MHLTDGFVTAKSCLHSCSTVEMNSSFHIIGIFLSKQMKIALRVKDQSQTSKKVSPTQYVCH